jgi:superfamily II DNA or RNA helicase/diadenosine tetraphosphate (Ap4A) HIT family hydrolase
MSSPFTKIPESDWIAENDHAFAIHDNYPVTEGHALVIPKEEVPTWFDATRDQQIALIDLVDEVKQMLDDRYAPDGYNVGINNGEAAGQTVFHLHIHVIPRNEGDVEDPTGGVRNVIPEKGNYRDHPSLWSDEHNADEDLVSDDTPDARLSTGGEDDRFMSYLNPYFHLADEVCVVSSFVFPEGVRHIQDSIESVLERGGNVRILTGDYLGVTPPRALEQLRSIQEQNQVRQDQDGEQGHFETRLIQTESSGWPESFHPKAWIFHMEQLGVAFVGSSNISYMSLEEGVEWNLNVNDRDDPEAFSEITEEFEQLWHCGQPLTREGLNAYKEDTSRENIPADDFDTHEESTYEQSGDEEIGVEDVQLGGDGYNVTKDPWEDTDLPEPWDIQEEAVEALSEARSNGRRRALVVLPMGTGKTNVAAYDLARFASKRGQPRVLYIAHREEILTQAKDTFSKLSAADRTSFGYFMGNQDDTETDFVFASIQKLGRYDNFQQFPHEAFDYVIMDEAHHSAAETYRRVLNNISPDFLLGLTGTPQRADEADILKFYDDYVAYRATMGDAIGLGILCPFHYRGIQDTVDYEPIPWRSNRFNREELTKAVESTNRMDKLREELQNTDGSRTLFFCCTKEHALWVRDWFQSRGMRLNAVISGPRGDDRNASVQALQEGRIDGITAVDIFNEGVDIPSLDRSVFLRPTESSVVFLQQLGRGLRNPENKDALQVLDMVGNHRVFLDRMKTLFSLGDADATDVRRFLEQNELPDLPEGCKIDIDVEAKELLKTFLPQSSRHELVGAYRDFRDTELDQTIPESTDEQIDPEDYRSSIEEEDQRPTPAKLERMGYEVKSVRNRKNIDCWFDFLKQEDDLTPSETTVLDLHRSWFVELEKTQMVKSYKMVVLKIWLESENRFEGVPFSELAAKCHDYIVRNPELFRDIQGVKQLGDDPEHVDDNTWERYWRGNPINAWTGGNTDDPDPWFRITDEDLFTPTFDVETEHRSAFREMTEELVDWRIVRYKKRIRRKSTEERFLASVHWKDGDPVLKLPSRSDDRPLPGGTVNVVVQDVPDAENPWRFKFENRYISAARPLSASRNQLPDLLRNWFGPVASRKGSDFSVWFTPETEDRWTAKPDETVIPAPPEEVVVTFPDLKAAADAEVHHSREPVSFSYAFLPDDLAEEHDNRSTFAVQVTGDSMDGPPSNIKDGDWLLMEWSRANPGARLENEVVIAMQRDESNGTSYHLKRLNEQDDGGWTLTSDHPDREKLAVNDSTTILARMIKPLPAGFSQVSREVEQRTRELRSKISELEEGAGSEGRKTIETVLGSLSSLINYVSGRLEMSPEQLFSDRDTGYNSFLREFVREWLESIQSNDVVEDKIMDVIVGYF